MFMKSKFCFFQCILREQCPSSGKVKKSETKLIITIIEVITLVASDII